MSTQKRYLFRYLLIALVFCTACVAYVGRLFYIQIAGRDSVYDDGTTVQTVKLPAVRGEILDRNGTPLVSNRYSYDMELSYLPLTTVGSAEANQTYLRLMEALDVCGATPCFSQSSFPFVGTYPDYAFAPDAQSTDTTVGYRLARILKTKGIKTDASVAEIVEEYLDTYRLLELGSDGRPLYSNYEIDRLLRLYYDMDVTQFGLYSNYTFAENADAGLMTYVKELGLTGVTFEVISERVYCYPGYASHILGTVGPIYAEEWDYYNEQGYPMNAVVGKEGCEAAFEEYLRGTDGEMKVTIDAAGNVIHSEILSQPISGKDVYLTIDIRLQIAAEEGLAENVQYVRENDGDAVEGFPSDSGAAVVMDPETFQILAIASYPTYDLSTFNADYSALASNAARPLTNRALRETYAPGSTFKPGMALVALEEGTVTAASTIQCAKVFTKLGSSYRPECFTYPHATSHLTVTQAIVDSCNCYFYELGYRLPISTVNSYMSRLGFGRATGIELREAVGSLAGESGTYVGEWTLASSVQASIGQSDTRATPLQLCAYASALSNGGRRYEAHLLYRVCAFGEESPVYTDDALLATPLDTLTTSQSSRNTVLSAMGEMVSGSTRARSFLAQSGVDYRLVKGKTGTAQFDRYVIDEATGETVKKELTNALFIGLYGEQESGSPELVVSVVIEKASSGTYASLTAARIFGAWEDLQESAD